jgi:tight adherence protein C
MNMMIVVLPILGAIAAFLFAISLLPSKSLLTKTLEALEGRMQSSAVEEGVLERALGEIISPERTGKLQRKLLEAGWYSVTPAQMMLRTVAGIVAGIALAMLAGHFLHLKPILVLGAQILAIVAAGYAPMEMLDRAAEERKQQVGRTLPDFLDMVAATVQAGLALNAALAYAVDVAPGALGQEMKEALTEIRLGRGKAEALKAAAYRLNHQELSTTISAITQADRLGANIARVLTELSDDARHQRILTTEEQAAKMPVKMVFPMALFLLPALVVIILGTVAANYFAQRGG